MFVPPVSLLLAIYRVSFSSLQFARKFIICALPKSSAPSIFYYLFYP